MLLSSILLGALAGSAAALGTEKFTEPKTGFTVTGYISSPYSFGVALPQTPGQDFIGVVVGTKANGYVGTSLGGPMLNALLLVVWPNGQKVLASLRKTANYGTPAIATGSFSLSTIEKGTYVNSTHFTYTFLCKSCLQGDGLTFSPTEASAVLGFAISKAAPVTKSSVTTSFPKHDQQGNYQLDMTQATTASYASYAALANVTKLAVGFEFEA
ncbi:hypothetical protein G7Y89_g1471 [Cudoniella acicularis]|uniref:Cellobiose dehydrogenase-like cytochrome domain-containing protein n=1 Tax=Cudoniella acicularis TaxID=354080 RepID=A0A8H4RW01_9HELO|nr:hypothetical protein G7Y89_g1471 [Cudoniella acicularis]